MENDEENYIQFLEKMYQIKKTVPNLSLSEIINKLADYYYKNEDYLQSIKYYEEALRYNKNNIEALARLAFFYAGQEYFEKADDYLKRLTEIIPDKEEYSLARGIINSYLNKREALEYFKKVIEINPEHTLGLLFLGIESFRKKYLDDNLIHQIEEKLKNILEMEIRYLFHKLLTGLYFLKKNYNKALYHIENCLQIVLKENFNKEEYLIRIAYACLGILGGDIESAHENLLILETRDFNDQNVIRLSDYRMNVEEGKIIPGQISPEGFDFMNFTQNHFEKFFPGDFIYKISNLKMKKKINLNLDTGILSSKKESSSVNLDFEEIINHFNSLNRTNFLEKSNQLIQMLGYNVSQILPPDDNEGFDCIAENYEGKKALIKIRQWKNQSISDIFLRNFQNRINETKVQEGFIISGAKLTSGAEQALQNLKKIKIINDEAFAKLLSNTSD